MGSKLQFTRRSIQHFNGEQKTGFFCPKVFQMFNLPEPKPSGCPPQEFPQFSLAPGVSLAKIGHLTAKTENGLNSLIKFESLLLNKHTSKCTVRYLPRAALFHVPLARQQLREAILGRWRFVGKDSDCPLLTFFKTLDLSKCNEP